MLSSMRGRNPWLNDLQHELREFLALAERALDDTPGPTPVQLDDVLAQERALVTQLRTGG